MTTVVIRMTDGSNQTYENILPGTTVAALKQRVAERQGISITAQKLIYGGAYLEDSNTLDSYNIREVSSSSLHAFVNRFHTPVLVLI